MDLQTLKEKEVKLLSRKRISLLADANATPSRKELIKLIAQKYNIDENLIVIKHIYPQFGKRKAKIIVHVYDDPKKMEIFEHKNLINKHKQGEKKEGA